MLNETKKYIKKVLVSNQLNTAEARAERLRRVRNMANLTRQEICNFDGLNINTYKGWEIARYGGLPVDGAEKIIQRVAGEGVICELEWLVHGRGNAPYAIPKDALFDANEKGNRDTKRSVFKEIMLFKNCHPDAVHTEVLDDSMSPIYEKGDFLAGINKHGEELNNLLGENCIVQITNGSSFIRRLMPSDTKDRFTLVCLNPKTQAKNPIIHNAELKSAAPISRHYKPV